MQNLLLQKPEVLSLQHWSRSPPLGPFQNTELVFSGFLLCYFYRATAFPGRWHIRVDRCHLPCLLSGFPCSLVSLRDISFSKLLSSSSGNVPDFSPKACISCFSTASCWSSVSKITSFSMTLDKKVGITFSLTKTFRLFGPQVLCLSGNLMLNPPVPCLMPHYSCSKSSWRREKNCLTGTLRSCQFERHRGGLWGLSAGIY